MGLVLLVGMIIISWASGAYGWTIFGKDLDLLHAGWILLKGMVFWIVILIGLLLIILGINDMKE